MAAAYTPFVLLTAGYLLLRYAVFGQVARESMLGTARVDLFVQDVSTHLRRMVFGEPGLAISAARAAVAVGIGGAAVALIGDALPHRRSSSSARCSVLLDNLGCSRDCADRCRGIRVAAHMYLASAGWAISLGIAFEVLWQARPRA